MVERAGDICVAPGNGHARTSGLVLEYYSHRQNRL